MAYNQYSKTAISHIDEETSNTAGSSSSSTWQSLLASNTRRRALGRVKITAMPQRLALFNDPCGEEDEEDLTPKNLTGASKSIDEEEPRKCGESIKTNLSMGENSNHSIFKSKFRNDIPQRQRPFFLHSSANTDLKNREDLPMSSSKNVAPLEEQNRNVSPISRSRHSSTNINTDDYIRSRSKSRENLPMPHRSPQLRHRTTSREGLPMPQRSPNPRHRSASRGENYLPMPQRSPLSRSRPLNRNELPMPQRSNNPPRKFGPVSPVRASPVRASNSEVTFKTPERPNLLTVNWQTKKPQSNPEVARSQSTPPIGRVSKSIHSETNDDQPQRPTISVNGKQYFLMDRIGQGGSSNVFQVLECRSSRMLAVKRVDLSEVSDSEATAFRNEVMLLERLRGNPRIVNMVDYEERPKPNGRGNELYVVMEHGERDLASLLKEVSASPYGLTDAKTKFYWEEMLEAVAVVHKENIVHSDLKPANFLLVGGMLKLIDFGIASSVSDDKTHVTKDNMMGTFNFMSPETILSRDDEGAQTYKISFKSDVWSLGCILYNLVFKKLPFAHIKNPMLKFQAIIDPEHQIKFPAEALQGHDPLVIEVLKLCLVRDPNKRASIDELLHHPYLKASKNQPQKQQHLRVDQLLSAISTLTPNSKKVVMENLTNSKIGPPSFDLT